ncbi:MAG: antitoxin VbhA family protein [Acidaminobacteraceae bacterium]
MLTNNKEINRVMKNVSATLSFEGLKPSRVANSANKKMLSGEITGAEARQMILSSYNLTVK